MRSNRKRTKLYANYELHRRATRLVRCTRPERSNRGSPTSSFCNQFFIDNTKCLPGDVWAGNLLASSKAWSPSVYFEILTSSSSFARTVRTSHYQQNRALKKPSGTVYRAHLRSGMFPCETAFSRVIVGADFSARLAFTSSRVSSASVGADVQDHKHRDRIYRGSW